MNESGDRQTAMYTWHVITAAHPYLGRQSSVENRMKLLGALNIVNDYWRGRHVPRIYVNHPGASKLGITIDTTRTVRLVGKRTPTTKKPPIKRVRSKFEFINIIKENIDVAGGANGSKSKAGDAHSETGRRS